MKKKKFDFRRLIFILIFLAGFATMAFPVVSQFLYYQASHEEINAFQREVAKIDSKEINRRIELAHAYNASLVSSGIAVTDPYSDGQKQAGRHEYARMLEVREQIGHVSIPRISQDLPIYAGTSEAVLQKGVGHLEGTSLPVGGENTHSVLSAHRGLPNAQLFTDLDKVKKGDVFYVHNLKETLAYEVDQISVIEPTDLDKLAIVPGQDYVTLLTCTPYMINSHRLLVRGHRIPYDEKVEEKLKKEANQAYLLYIAAVVAILLLLLLILWLIFRRRRKDKDGKKAKKAAK